MVESNPKEKKIDNISSVLKGYNLNETMEYPNGGYSLFYTRDDQAVIIDFDICRCEKKEDVFPYSLITDKQNHYMKYYRDMDGV